MSNKRKHLLPPEQRTNGRCNTSLWDSFCSICRKEVYDSISMDINKVKASVAEAEKLAAKRSHVMKEISDKLKKLK